MNKNNNNNNNEEEEGYEDETMDVASRAHYMVC